MKTRLDRLALAATAAVLAGCGSLVPTYERPAAPVAAVYPGDTGVAVAPGSRAADIEWRRFFGDARLKRLIELALQNNRDLRVAVLNVDRVRAQYQIQRADRFPSLNGVVAASRQPNTGGSGSITTYQVGLSVTSYELDFFGRVKNLSDAALATYLSTAEARKTAQISLISSVANSYLATLADDELLALTRDTLRTREDSFKLSKLMFDNGVASELDLREAESLVESGRATLAQLLRQRAVDQNALTLLIGQPMPADLPASSTLAATALGPELPAGLPSDLLTTRPDIRSAEQTLLAANADIGAARAAFFPRITLTGTAGTASTQLSGLFEGGSYGWTFAPQLVLPIFDGGRNQANLEVAQASRDIAVAQYEKAIQSAFSEVADALAGRANLGEQLRALRAQADAEAARFKLSDLLFRNGAASYLALLDAQRALFAAQQAAIQVQLTQLQNQVTLYQALGGGWTDPPAVATTQ